MKYACIYSVRACITLYLCMHICVCTRAYIRRMRMLLCDGMSGYDLCHTPTHTQIISDRLFFSILSLTPPHRGAIYVSRMKERKNVLMNE